jgi:membrane-associated protease RseP (regulator of RpoE activity)
MTPVSTDPYIGPPKVAGVRPYSPAARAEVRAGDVITAIAGEPTPYNGDIRQRLGRHDAGQTVRFSLLRDGMAIERDLELVGELPPFVPQRLGLHARSEGASLLVTHVDADSPAGRLGLQSGDRLTMASEQTIDSPSALRQALIAHPPGEAFSLRWIRGEQAMQGESVLERISEAVPKEAVTGDEWPTKWQSKSLPLPDVKNLAWALVPDEGEPPPQSLGLVILLAEPGAAKPEELLRGLEDLAGRAGVVFAVVTATLPERWDGSELEVVERVANQLQNSLPIQSDRILVAGRGAAGAMALVVALAKRATFRAAAVEFEKLPRLRLSENDPGQSVQLLFAGPVATEAPVESLRRLGYPVRLQGSIPSPQDWLDLLGRFNRSLDEF